MFDIGFGEMLVLAAIALIAIGPKQLPEVARTVGRMLNEFKRATGDLTKNFTDHRNYVDEIRNDLMSATNFNETTHHAADQMSSHAPHLASEHEEQTAFHDPGPQPEPAEEQLSFAMTESEKKES